MPTFISLKQVAETLGVSGDTVRKIVDRGDLVGYRIGAQLRFDKADVESYLESAKTNHQSKEAV